MNARLRSAIQSARSANMPKDNIKRAIDKSTISTDSNFESIRYEGFGPNKTAVIVQTLTDNKNRTASSIRTLFQKYGGGLGTQGSASHNFQKLGIIKIEKNVLMTFVAHGAVTLTSYPIDFNFNFRLSYPLWYSIWILLKYANSSDDIFSTMSYSHPSQSTFNEEFFGIEHLSIISLIVIIGTSTPLSKYFILIFTFFVCNFDLFNWYLIKIDI